MSSTDLALVISVFLACAVEAVEAVTIVLAAGTARDWKSALLGTGAGLGLLAIVIAILGPNISKIDDRYLKLFVGTLLLLFGLQWIRKSILRSSGYKSLHDEEKIFQEELLQAKKAQAGKRFGVADWYAFTLSFKGVLLEGLEVVFIVLTFGSIRHKVMLSAITALITVLIVSAAGFVLRKPLSRIPENQMKFIVGIALTSFGIYWGAEGAGAVWPKSDAALIPIVLYLLLLSYGLTQLLKRKKKFTAKITQNKSIDFDELDSAQVLKDRGFKRPLKDFGYFWYDFLIGDDLIGFAIVLAALESTYLLTHAENPFNLAWAILPLAVSVLIPVSLFRSSKI